MSLAVPRGFEKLYAALEWELAAKVEAEEVATGRFRLTVVSPNFTDMPHLKRQDLIWDIVDRELPRDQVLAITLIFAYSPADLQAV